MVKATNNSTYKVAVQQAQSFSAPGKVKTNTQRAEAIKARQFAKAFLAKSENVTTKVKEGLSKRAITMKAQNPVGHLSARISTATYAKPITVN